LATAPDDLLRTPARAHAAHRKRAYRYEMNQIGRRQFLQNLGAAAAAFAAPQPASNFDLLIAGGRVIDPARPTDRKLDIAVVGSKIAAVGANLSREHAKRVLDATGKIVVPGLIDMHGHVFDQFLPVSINADEIGLPDGVTTIVDAGSAGANTFPAFRKYVIEGCRTRVYSLLNISTIGLVVQNELYLDPKMIDAKAAIRTINENRGMILGIKVRITGRDEDVPHDIGVLKVARDVSNETGVPVMMHWTNDPKLLTILKKGDVLTHPFNPPRSGPNLLGSDGKVLPQILELKDRGIFTDFAHGNHLQWATAEKAAQQGWFPDTISTDIHRAHAAPNGVVIDLVTTMSKFLLLGLSMNQVIEKVTANPARILNFPDKVGTLEVDGTAEISILESRQGDFAFLDSTREARTAHQRLAAVAVVHRGELTMAA
jgi:dihydroorotase